VASSLAGGSGDSALYEGTDDDDVMDDEALGQAMLEEAYGQLEGGRLGFDFDEGVSEEGLDEEDEADEDEEEDDEDDEDEEDEEEEDEEEGESQEG
jgi:hypothetical protein